jgi:3-oxoacyl-[acyl-carrier protein] reductase
MSPTAPPTPTPDVDLSGHVAIVTGANHGIGAATAKALAGAGASVLLSYLRLDDAPDPGIPRRLPHQPCGDRPRRAAGDRGRPRNSDRHRG